MSILKDEKSAAMVSDVLEIALAMTLRNADLPRLSDAQRGGLTALRDVAMLLDADLEKKIQGMLDADITAEQDARRAA